jgi:hypothetical protein
MTAARKVSRCGHRDATMILIAYHSEPTAWIPLRSDLTLPIVMM